MRAVPASESSRAPISESAISSRIVHSAPIAWPTWMIT